MQSETEIKVEPDYDYEIIPRPADLGGGWKLRLLEDGVEVGGGVFPAADSSKLAHELAHDEALAEATHWLCTRP